MSKNPTDSSLLRFDARAVKGASVCVGTVTLRPAGAGRHTLVARRSTAARPTHGD